MTPSRGGGLIESGRNLLATVVALLATRVELLATEVEEEKLRLRSLLAWAIAAFFFLGFGTLLLALLLTVLWWDTHRLAALLVFTLVFLVAGGIAFLVLRRRLRRGSQLFAASLAELARDRDSLRGRD